MLEVDPSESVQFMVKNSKFIYQKLFIHLYPAFAQIWKLCPRFHFFSIFLSFIKPLVILSKAIQEWYQPTLFGYM